MTQEQLRGTSPPLVCFPPGEPVFTERACNENLFTKVDALLDQGYCASGWLEFESPDTRLTCLIHQGKPYLAGLIERNRFSWVPLREDMGSANGTLIER
jgi:hypothetical protein